MARERKKLKIGRWVLLAVLVFFVLKYVNQSIDIQEKIEIVAGGNFYDFLDVLEKKDALRLKMHLKLHKEAAASLSTIAQGRYDLSGSYSCQEFIDFVVAGPTKEYTTYTVLEGRSIYDIDASLTQKELIQEGAYLAFVMDQDNIAKYMKNYAFLDALSSELIVSLEGFLYPDTYYLDKGQNVLEQLVKLQLDAFEKKIWTAYQDDILSFPSSLSQDYNLDFSRYDAVSLASVVEKEERSDKNKPIVAGIFFNRLTDGMRLDADITLCYGLKEPYETCTPEVIGRGIYDENNVFNTRKRSGLVPQPIANVSHTTVSAVLNYKKTNNYYYLHDNNGNIHYGKTVGEHNANKNKYLR